MIDVKTPSKSSGRQFRFWRQLDLGAILARSGSRFGQIMLNICHDMVGIYQEPVGQRLHQRTFLTYTFPLKPITKSKILGPLQTSVGFTKQSQVVANMVPKIDCVRNIHFRGPLWCNNCSREKQNTFVRRCHGVKN